MLCDINKWGVAVDQGNAIVIVETQLQGAGSEFLVPVRQPFSAKAQVPFSNTGGRVSMLFEQSWKRLLLCANQERFVVGQWTPYLLTPAELSGQEAIPGRCAHRRW